MSSSVHSNLLRKQKKVDPFSYYDVVTILGEGSMGSVTKVVKKQSARGGSARPDFVKSRHQGCCSFILNCLLPSSPSNNVGVWEDLTDSSSVLSSLKETPNSNNKKRMMRSSSSRITYGTKTNKHYALKSLILDRCSNEVLRTELENEVEILKSLDHPNIVRAMETFDFDNRMYILLELCEGGDLYTRDPYTEREVVRILNGLFKGVAYLHVHGVVHRDLKFENIMFVDNRPEAEVRLIDFGLSQKFAANQHLHEAVGTTYTMAPELIHGNYDSKVDVWSLGVISFMLLSSSLPFYGRNRKSVIKKILKGKYDFASRRWNHVSDTAKEFVQLLLQQNPKRRPSAREALRHPWMLQTQNLTAEEAEEMEQIQASIHTFSGYRALKKLALMVVAYKSTAEEIGWLRKLFNKFDSTNDGEISFEEFKVAMSENYSYSDAELEALFRGIDIDGTGTVHYMEFLAATLEARGSIDEERLAEAFDRIDNDDSGSITVRNLRDFLGNDVPLATLHHMIDEADLRHDKKIAYDEFLSLWNEGDDETMTSNKMAVGSKRLAHSDSSFSIASEVSVTASDSSMSQLTFESSGCDYFKQRKEISIRMITTDQPLLPPKSPVSPMKEAVFV